ncbi:MAG: LLM class flavin-dependent oxidoreductase [Candidatus Bathyarchaeia archaeon]
MGKVRFGCYLPIPATPVDRLLKIAVLNEEAGFDSLWVPDHVLFQEGIVPEAWCLLSALAVTTRKVLLGTAVSDPHRYHPVVFAQKVATVSKLSGGRVALGLGAGEAINLDPLGIDWKIKPVAKMVEAITIMRRLWNGEVLDFEGKFWKLKNAFLQITPVNNRVPIYLGANAPRTLRLTGEIADGLWSIPLPPQLFRKRFEMVKEGAEGAGRSIDEIDTGLYLYTAVSERREEALQRILSFKFRIITSPKVLSEAGYNVPEDLKSISFFEYLRDPRKAQFLRDRRFSELIPDQAAIDFSIAGTIEDCIEKIEEYIKAGVRHFLLMNIGPDPRWTLKAYSEKIIPCFRENKHL